MAALPYPRSLPDFQRFFLDEHTMAPSYRDIYDARGLGESVHPRGSRSETSG